jgi:uracil-DNA glycosylase
MVKTKIPAIEDKPKLLENEAAIVARLEQRQEPHVKQLNDYIDALRSKSKKVKRRIPYFDPWDGGVTAECLFLLEAPGGKAVNFISRNNNDETAKNFFKLNTDAKLPRKRTISWNIVPWYIGDENEKKIRAATVKDINDGIPHLLCLLDLLPKLRAIVFVGKKAQSQRVKSWVEKWRIDNRRELRLFDCPHPSPRVLYPHPEKKVEILNVLKEVLQFIGAN